MDLSTTTTSHGDWSVVSVSGEVDVYSAPVLRDRLDAPIRAGNYRLIVDLAKVTFMDSTGLGVLVGRLKLLRMHDGALVIVGPGERVRKVFGITGLDKVFAIYDSVDDAVSAS